MKMLKFNKNKHLDLTRDFQSMTQVNSLIFCHWHKIEALM